MDATRAQPATGLYSLIFLVCMKGQYKTRMPAVEIVNSSTTSSPISFNQIGDETEKCDEVPSINLLDIGFDGPRNDILNQSSPE